MYILGRNTNKSYHSKIDKTHLFQQNKYYRIVIIYFKCGLFVKIVEKSRLQNFIRILLIKQIVHSTINTRIRQADVIISDAQNVRFK